MSSDSTKLTFVRCPSCRSLVPAVSTRCRMCGATLDRSEESEELQHEHKPTGRVRQRTMSQPDNEVQDAAGQLRDQETEAEPEESSYEQSSPVPLYEEVEDPQFADSEYERDPLADFITEPEAESELDEQQEPIGEQLKGSGESTSHKKHAEVIIESGSRRSGGLSFGKPAEKTVRPPKEESVVQESRKALNEMQKLGKRRPQPERSIVDSQEVSQDELAPITDKSQPSLDNQEKQELSTLERHRPVEEAQPQKAAKAVLQKSGEEPVPGRLYGWLVSYADPAGSAIELREGKFFLTRNSLKDSDLVIADGSISTPHAMFTVGVKTGLVVQDLMSDRGVFVRRVGFDTYKREDSAVVVENGDWLRFGDVEFVVTLVSHVGQE